MLCGMPHTAFILAVGVKDREAYQGYLDNRTSVVRMTTLLEFGKLCCLYCS